LPKRVLEDLEVAVLPTKIRLEAPHVVIRKEDEEEYTGPTREEIEAENQRLIEEAKQEAAQIIADAKEKAEKIIAEAEAGAFEHIKNATEKAKKTEEEIKAKADEYVIKKKEELQKQIQEQTEKLKKEYEETKERAYKEGYDAGYNSGRAEVERLIKRLHVVIEKAIDKREEIITESEEQVIRIILLIVRKVVKAISEEQKGVVVENIKAAMNKIKGKTEVTIRVNTEDLELATEHKEELMQMFEELKHVTILEDTRVDKGGCIIETDFGSVDARISTQLNEIEEKIRELASLPYFKIQKQLAKDTEELKNEIDKPESESVT